MKPSYDFSKGKRGAVRAPQPELAGKVKVSIRLDADIVDHFMEQADKSGGKVGYQSLINEALRSAITAPALKDLLRQVIREEMKAATHPS